MTYIEKSLSEDRRTITQPMKLSSVFVVCRGVHFKGMSKNEAGRAKREEKSVGFELSV